MSGTRPRRPRTADPRSQGVGRDVLEARIATLEPTVLRQGNVTSEQLAEWRPGGKENPDPSASGLLTYLCQLHRWHATGPQQPTSSASPRWTPQALDDVRAALAADPVYVTLASGERRGVFPKSQFALHRIAFLDRALAWAAEQRLALELAHATDAVQLEALQAGIQLQTRLEREFAEIVCHPGPELPWPDGAGWDPPLAPWSATLDPLDLLALRKAFLDVNLLRLHTISERTRALADGDTEAMPLASFLGVMANDLGVQPSVIARQWSLGEVFAQALVKWDANERATAKADAARQQERT